LQHQDVCPAAQVAGDVVATATFTLKCQQQTLLYLPASFAAVQMVVVSTAGGTPGPFPSIPAAQVWQTAILGCFKLRNVFS